MDQQHVFAGFPAKEKQSKTTTKKEFCPHNG